MEEFSFVKSQEGQRLMLRLMLAALPGRRQLGSQGCGFLTVGGSSSSELCLNSLLTCAIQQGEGQVMMTPCVLLFYLPGLCSLDHSEQKSG